MSLSSRLKILKNKTKPIEDKIMRAKEELQSKEEVFYLLNLAIAEVYPTHRWNKLSIRKKRRIFFEEPEGTYDTSRILPKFIPHNKKEFDLLGEVCRLYADFIYQEILRRRALKRGKLKNN